MSNTAIQIDFWIKNKQKYAIRYSDHVPQIGDEVRFKGVAYKVTYRIFIYDEEYDRIALNIVPVAKARNRKSQNETTKSNTPPQ